MKKKGLYVKVQSINVILTNLRTNVKPSSILLIIISLLACLVEILNYTNKYSGENKLTGILF